MSAPARTVLVTFAALALLLTGCFGPYWVESNEVDEARAAELAADVWLAGADVEVARPAPGTNGRYHPGTALLETPLGDRSAVQALLSEVEAAQAEGWVAFYGRCPGEERRWEGLDNFEEGALVVAMTRPLDDGAPAQAVLRPGIGDPHDYVRVVKIAATVPHHTVVAPAELPPEVDVTTLACLRDDGDGPDAVGDPVKLTRDW